MFKFGDSKTKSLDFQKKIFLLNIKMSSVLKSYGQIPDRVQYFLGIGEAVCQGEVLSELSIVTMSAYPGAIVTNASADGLWESACPEGGVSGLLYKDMGATVNVYDDNRLLIAVFRKVQLVDGASTEGVGDATQYYIKVWSADGLGVVFARTG
jgi:hypothetical protein